MHRALTRVSSAKRRRTRKPQVADEQDANEGEAAQDPQGADDAEAQDGAPEDLKVVVSIKGGRATIGVKQHLVGPVHRIVR